VELYPEPKRLGQQLKYADQRGFRVALIAGDQEMARETCQVKDLRTGQSREVSWSGQAREVVETVSALLAAP
jgi:histidyl-tRNA synthetase